MQLSVSSPWWVYLTDSEHCPHFQNNLKPDACKWKSCIEPVCRGTGLVMDVESNVGSSGWRIFVFQMWRSHTQRQKKRKPLEKFSLDIRKIRFMVFSEEAMWKINVVKAAFGAVLWDRSGSVWGYGTRVRNVNEDWHRAFGEIIFLWRSAWNLLFQTQLKIISRWRRRMRTREEVIGGFREKGSNYGFIDSPGMIQSLEGNLGDSVSGGERQRIGTMRAFLHDAKRLFCWMSLQAILTAWMRMNCLEKFVGRAER